MNNERPNYVTLKDLAGELGMDRSHLRKYVIGHGIDPIKIRTLESQRQKTLAITLEQAQTIRAFRESEGYMSDQVTVEEGVGIFYVVQTAPELRAGRVKLGYTNSLQRRFTEYRTVVPTATILTSRPCRASWEIAARESITRLECQRIGPEVYDCDNLAALQDRLHDFFELMPTIA